MSKAVVAGAVIVVVAAAGGGGYYYMNQQAEKDLKNTIAFVENQLPGSSLKYETYNLDVLSKSVTLNKVTFKDANGQVYTADKVVAPISLSDNIAHLEIDKLKFDIKSQANIDVGHAEINNLKVVPDLIKIENGKIRTVYLSKAVFDSLKANDLTAISPQKEVVKIASVAVKNYGLDRKSDQNIQGIEIQPNQGKDYAKIANVQVDGLGLAKIIQNLENNQSPSLEKGEPTLSKIDGVDVVVRNKSWKLAKAESLRNIDSNGNIQFSSNFSGAVIPVQRSYTPAFIYLKQLGYDSIEASGNVKADYSKEKSQWSISPFALQIKDLGDLTVNTTVNGPDSVNTNPMIAMSEYKLVSFSVNLQNQGLVKHIVGTISKETGKSEADATQELLKTAQSEADRASLPIQKELINALISVINKPTSPVIIEAKPTSPATLMEIGMKAQQNQINDLNITIKN